MSKGPEKNKVSDTKRKLGKLPLVLSLLGASFLATAGIGELDASRQNNARAEAIQTITDCRDVVRCTLGKISLAVQSQFPGLRKVNYELTGSSVTLGGEIFKIGQSPEHGGVLEAENGEYFMATRDINNTVANVEAVLASKSEK